MALLFRASTAFPIYEDALEAAGIPFVTVAGKGFYDRPEIRDLLNALTALADPSDDLALAGLLRSPAFSLSDADLYHLRFPDGADHPQPLYQSLREASNSLFSPAAETITALHALAGRLPVAELLKRFLDLTHYRAILKTAGGSQRLGRNVDKLLADAHRSRLVSVNDFLDYVNTLRDVGAREGEAPAEVSGAVQLMTIHKAKGLEFPLVVVADAAYEHRGGSTGTVSLDPERGVMLRVTGGQAWQRHPHAVSWQRHPHASVSWQLGALADADREAAEDLRLLYVALTRAKEKVVVSGHAKISASKNDPGRLMLSGWLEKLGEVVGLDALRLPTEPLEETQPLNLPPEWAADIAASLHLLLEGGVLVEQQPAPVVTTLVVQPLAPGPLTSPLLFQPAAPETGARDRVWRVIMRGAGRSVPAWVVGQLVHEAVRRWTFDEVEERLRPAALGLGLADEADLSAALREASRLLERFQAHPIFAEIGAASERHHEVPYLHDGDAGVIDLLYRTPEGWAIADFKTDELRGEAELQRVLPRYSEQLRRYAAAVMAHLRLPTRPRAQLVFLNLEGAVQVMVVY